MKLLGDALVVRTLGFGNNSNPLEHVLVKVQNEGLRVGMGVTWPARTSYLREVLGYEHLSLLM
jgi:hypothetical protein